jgi:F-type H+-transporting ATPase subunit gamma
MEMLSVVKIYHLRKQVEESVPYVEKLRELLLSISGHISADVTVSPLFEARPVEKSLLIILTSDRGFCGAFNTNVTSLSHNFIENHNTILGTTSKKTAKHFKKDGYNFVIEEPGLLDHVTFSAAQKISDTIKKLYITNQVQSVSFAYMEFQSVLKQESVIREMLPLVPITKGEKKSLESFIFKPNPQDILDGLMSNYVDLFVYKVLLEAAASEQAMRRMSMHRATENAQELGQKLWIKYQRTRQAAITKELTEITSGANAIKER